MRPTRIACLAGLGAVALATLGAAFLLWEERAPPDQVGMAVEFTDHAAAAYLAWDQGRFQARGLPLGFRASFVTGMALAAALARQDVQVAFMCLVPAIHAFANAGVRLKIVAGTHRLGYGLVVDPRAVRAVEDLAREDVRVGCVREGGAVDVLMNRALDTHRLDRQAVLRRVRRMPPPELLLAIRAGQLEAAFLPEPWASMAEDLGFRMLADAGELWPGVPGSVLVVKEELLKRRPELVRGLVEVTEETTRWIHAHPEQAAEELARALSVVGQGPGPADLGARAARPDLSPALMLRSMRRLDYTTALDAAEVQAVIDYLAELGTIRASFPAERMMDTRFSP